MKNHILIIFSIISIVYGSCALSFDGARVKELDDCVLIYVQPRFNNKSAVLYGYLSLRNANELVELTNGLRFIYAKNSTEVYADESQKRQLIDAFVKCVDN